MEALTAVSVAGLTIYDMCKAVDKTMRVTNDQAGLQDQELNRARAFRSHACPISICRRAGGSHARQALTLAQPGPTNSIEELLQQGQAELVAKEWRAAAATFRTALELEPGDANAHAGLGRSLCELGQFKEAIASLNKVLELAPTNPSAHYHLALCHYKLEDFEHAASSFQQAMASDPTNAEGHYWLSRALSHLRRPAEAEAAIRKAIALGAAPARYYRPIGSLPE